MTKTILDYPFRSPLNVSEALKDIIKDKIVCDVGCACGDLMFEFSKYAKKVIGVEHEKERADIARSRGLEVSDNKIPNADVYYIWVNDWGLIDVMEKLKNRKGTFILVEESRDKSLGGYEIEVPVPKEEILEKYKDFTNILHLQIVELL